MAVSKRDDSVLPDGPGESAQHALDEETKAWMPSFVLVACFREMTPEQSVDSVLDVTTAQHLQQY